MVSMKRINPIFVFICSLTLASCSSFPSPSDPGVPRRTGECTDSRFKAAELEAYTELVRGLDAAEKATRDEISSIVKVYKQNILKKNDDYQSTLNQCGDTDCSQKAKSTYDQAIEAEQTYHDDAIWVAQGKEQAAKQQALDDYNQAVDKARRLYCAHAYEASGTQLELTYYGIICDLEQPFTISATSPYYEFTIQLNPSGSDAGSFSYSGTWFDVGPVSGSGSYVVQYSGEVAVQLILNSTHTTYTEEGNVTGPPQYNFKLVPLETETCN